MGEVVELHPAAKYKFRFAEVAEALGELSRLTSAMADASSDDYQERLEELILKTEALRALTVREL